MSGSWSQLLAPSGGKLVPFRSRVGRKSRLTQQRGTNHWLAAWRPGRGDSGTGFWFLGGCGGMHRGLSVLLSASPAGDIPGTAACRPAPATLLAALRHPALAVKLLSVAHLATLLIELCTSVGPLLGSLLFSPWLGAHASSPRKGRRASWPSLVGDVVILSLRK